MMASGQERPAAKVGNSNVTVNASTAMKKTHIFTKKRTKPSEEVIQEVPLNFHASTNSS